MNKIVNRALFYKEWIYVKWVTLLTIIVLLYFKVYGVISALNREKMFETRQGWVLPNRWFNNGLYGGNSEYIEYLLIMVFVVIVLAITLFIGEKTSETKGFIVSMPFTRKEIIINKWLIGVVSLLISFAVTYIFLSLFYFKNISSINTTLNPYSDIVKWFFMDTFQYICLFTFMMLIQAVMGNSIVAGIVGGVVLLIPYFITLVLQSLFDRYPGFNQSRYINFDNIRHWSNVYGYNYTNKKYLSSTAINGMCNISYINYKSKLLVLFLLTCLFLYLVYIAYKKINIEYNLRLIVFKNLEPVFIVGFSICLGLLAGVMGFQRLREFAIRFVIFTIIGYFISKLLLKILSKGK